MPNAKIKIAYSMLESTLIPEQWVQILNTRFDLVVVPDKWLIKVYKNSGVTIPIFTIPIPLYLEEFLAYPIKHKRNAIFTFGMSAACVPGKNHTTLVRAFNAEFKDSKEVQLKVHVRWGTEREELLKLLSELKASNIELIDRVFNQKEYIEFFGSLDAYVLPSSGEGYSVTPREAMAMGIPCILSNNTAHKTICKTKLVVSIESTKQIPAYYKVFGGICGNKFKIEQKYLQKALRNCFTNYHTYIKKNKSLRKFAEKYQCSNLFDSFVALVKPNHVVLHDTNKVSKGILMTNSKVLYEKYRNLIA
jgi:hypothetical protein